MKAPIETLFIIADRNQEKNILKTLTTHKIYGKILTNANGTAKSMLGDIFGFGIIEKDVIISFVETDKGLKICTLLNKLINKEKDTGIVFTVPIDAISSDLFEFVMGGKNG